MSLILQGIDMPKETDGLSITFHSQDGVMETHILDATQAIQIPKGHGRLIDGDKIDFDEFWHREGQGFTIAVCQKAQQIIEEQPTILEAEE